MNEEQILDFKKQLDFNGELMNAENFIKKDKYVLHGMGGSALVGDILRGVFPSINLIIHRNYGMPEFMPWKREEDLHIFSSYSGNTEEVLDGLTLATAQKINSAVITSGGRLLEMAKEFGIPYVVLPAGIQPRMALGYFLKAVSMLIAENLSGAIKEEKNNFDVAGLKEASEKIVELSGGKPFLIYSSNQDSAVGYIWKIKLNENAKHPAFSNSIPEANHNEIEYLEDPKIRASFFPVFIMSNENDLRIKKRMEILMGINEEYKIPQISIELAGKNRLGQLLHGILLADFVSFRLAENKGVDSEKVSILEEFKQKIKN